MQLFLVNFILIVYAFSSYVRADAVTDAIHLQGLASNTADTIFASLNGTAYLVSLMQRLMIACQTDGIQNTSDLVSQMTVAIQGADSMLMSNTVRSVMSLNSSLGRLVDTLQSSLGTANVTLNDAYLNVWHMCSPKSKHQVSS